MRTFFTVITFYMPFFLISCISNTTYQENLNITRSGKLVFSVVYDNGTKQDIYTVVADGTEPKHLPTHLDNVGYPSWSPNGENIAFSASQGEEFGIFIMLEDGSQVHSVTPQLFELGKSLESNGVVIPQPDWHMDGHKIIFSFNGDIAILNVEDGTISKILTDIYCNKAPKWSPDGIRFVFSSNRSGGWNSDQLYSATIAGKPVKQLTFYEDRISQINHTALDWSPNGDWVAMRERGITLIKPEDKERKLLMEGEECPHGYASFSPDGQWVVLACGQTKTNKASVYFYHLDLEILIKADINFGTSISGFAGVDWAP